MLAWMIGNNGEAVEVTQHPYGNPDIEEIEETLAAAEWFDLHTNHPSIHSLIVRLFSSWAYSKFGSVEAGDIKKYLLHLPHRVVSSVFIDGLTPELDIGFAEEPEGINRLICAELNQEFLRARYGGMYDTEQGNRDMYFRTSSVCFDWLTIICAFVAERKIDIETVTIIRDVESTGTDGQYLNCNGISINHMVKADFLNIPECPTAINENQLLVK